MTLVAGAEAAVATDRRTMIANMVEEGALLREIGDVLGVTRERARQLIEKCGLGERRKALRAAAENKRLRAERRARAIHRWTRRARKIQKFWNNVATGEGCWEWQAARNPTGYGHLNGQSGGYAHRYAWELANGRSIPPGMCILHRCDNPPCVRPDHLMLGTHRDNIRDAIAKGRMSHAKLTLPDIEAIGALRGSASAIGLAGRYGVTRSTIYRVWRQAEADAAQKESA